MADTRYEDKFTTMFDQHNLLLRLFTLEGHAGQMASILLGTQGAVVESFAKAMTALGVSKTNQMILAQKLSDHAGL